MGKKIVNMLFIINLIVSISVLGQATIKVDDFGALGDGSTNDVVAIQNALNSLKADGGELQFTSGKVYVIQTGLRLSDYPSSKHYRISTTGEEKATIKMIDGGSLSWNHWIIFVDNSKNVEISNLILDGNRDTRNPTEQSNGTHVLQVYDNCNGLRLENVEMVNSPMDNLYIGVRTANVGDSTYYLSDFEMYNCLLKNGYRNNMSVIRGKNFKIIGCEFTGAQGNGDPEAGIDFEPNSGGSALGYRNILVEGCLFKDNKRMGITLTSKVEIEKEGSVIIRNNIFDNNGIMVVSPDNIISNNVFINMDHSPVVSMSGTIGDGIIYLYHKGTCQNNKVYNNYFFDNPMPVEESHSLIYFSSRTGANNSVYDNYAFNNTTIGIVKNSSGQPQTIFNNVELARKEMGYWNMDSDSISGNSLFDLSDFNQTGILHNNPSIVNGQYNEALDFSSNDKYVEIPIKRNINTEMNLTISAWIKWNGTNGETEQVIVGKDNDWRFGINNSGKIGFYAPNTSGESYTGGWVRSDITIPLGVWSYVTATYNGMNTRVYVDGVSTASKVCYGKLDTNSRKIYLGSLAGDTYSFNGIIDDIKLYNYALSETEIDSLSKIISGHNKTEPLGSGTEADPYQIKSIVNLSWLAQSPDKWNAHYIQVANIDASITANWDDSDDNGDGDKYNDLNDKTSEGNNEGWYPIGNSTQKFSGSYNGNGHTVSAITIKNRSTNGNGFFGEVDGGAIQNLGITKLDIHGNSKVGGLVALCSNNSISNSYTTGIITLSDGEFVGGFAGKITTTSISNCYSEVKIIGSGNNNKVGGLIGEIGSTSAISRCYSLGSLETVGESVGGFVGYITDGSIVNESYSIGNVKSNNSGVGGFTGKLNGATIKDCYSFGSVLKVSGSSGNNFGGFVGEVQDASVVEHCYSIGEVDNSFTGQGFTGVIISGTPTFKNNIFDVNLSGQASSVGAEGKTSVDMMNAVTFTSAGWDMTTVWKMKGNYPNLRENANVDLEYGGFPGEIPGLKGSGTEEDPYQIASLQNLALLSQNNTALGAFYVQTTDIDASQTAMWDDSDDNNDGNNYNDPNDLTTEGSNEGFSPIGNEISSFTGVYDGGEFTISNLKINRPSLKYIGFFGQIESPSDKDAVVKNLLLNNETIIGNGYVGGFVGKNSKGKILKCSSHGTINSSSATGYIGGFVGYNLYSGSEIINCLSKAEINSTGSGSYIGGFVGRNHSGALISKCYSESTILNAGEKVGGFAGQIATSTINNCYSKGAITGSGSSVGGFCGAVYSATIEYCYSTGVNSAYSTKGFLGTESSTNIYTSNYLDKDASGCTQTSVPLAATEKTTSEMKTESTYVGWDFTNIWGIEAGNYPLLTGVVVSVKEKRKNVIPTAYVLEQNYPNPFNPTTVISFSLPTQTNVRLSVYNILGEKVTELVNGYMSAGYHTVNFDASNLTSGIYIYRISAGNFNAVKKMMLLK